MELRGFDSYTVTLGDELRGERACRGWSIRDAARELCIKPEMIEAIEEADLAAFPNRSVVPGYVRSYGRYLGKNGDETFRKFCDETGFESTLVTFGMTEAAGGARPSAKAAAVTGAVGADFTASRFAVRPAPRRIGATVSLGGIVSAVSLCGLLVALGYGGYTVLQDIQRVGFAPLPDAPAVVADAPEIVTPAATVRTARPDASAYSAGGAIFGLETSRNAAVIRRDGPIASIDPDAIGLVTRPALARSPSVVDRTVGAAATGQATAPVGLPGEVTAAPVERRGQSQGRAGITLAADAPTDAIGSLADQPRRIVVTDRAWLRVRDDAGNNIFEGILEPGDSFDIPEGVTAPVLRAGNAGDVFFAVGERRYGPLGAPGAVIKDVSLSLDAITDRFSTGQPALETPLTSASR
ncbi:MAG: helix-turn-helix domain-containing protein [Pseudomonadota bacterium]